MLKNYLKIAFRNIKKQKFYSAINILGLSIGFTVCILVALYINQDLNYDTYHTNANKIYRVCFQSITSEGKARIADTPGLVAQYLQEEYPEVEKATRIYFSEENFLAYKDSKFYETNGAYADSTFFDIFSYKTIKGSKADLLKRPNTIVLTETVAKKYFGNQNPLGKTIKLDNKFDMEITGVIEDVPINSHFSFDFLLSYSTLYHQDKGKLINQWSATFGSYTYFLSSAGFNLKNFQKKTEDFHSKHTKSSGTPQSLFYQPILDIHLKSNLANEIHPNSSVLKLTILGSIAFIILILACINFINLTTARSTKRAKEIGMRKVLGAIKIQLMKQFISESIFLSIISMVLSLVTVNLILPLFNNLVSAELQIGEINLLFAFSILFLVVIIIGTIAGAYPAFVISAYKPVNVLKGNKISESGKNTTAFLRKSLVIFQFTITIILIITTLFVNRQIDFMRNYNMGFDKEQMLILKAPKRIGQKYQTIKNEINSIPGVIKSASALNMPLWDDGYGVNLHPKSYDLTEEIGISVNFVDFDFFETFDIDLITGQNLSKENTGEFGETMVITESLAKKIGFENPHEVIGKQYLIGFANLTPRIIGVVKDYHACTLHETIHPQVFMYSQRLLRSIAAKIETKNMDATIKEIEKVWTKFYPEYPFKYNFLDKYLDNKYKADLKYFSIISTFSIIAILIACLGLLGLASFMAEQRTKEIGIRKVLGASVSGLIKLLSLEFLKWILLANIIAWPVAYYIVNQWLLSFAYRTNLNVFIFILAAAITILIAAFTVSFQAVKAARTNPVETLKYE